MNFRALKWVYSLVDFFQGRSFLACSVYVCMYVFVSLVCLPLTPIEIFTGFCFGVPFGILLDVIGRVLGAVVSFLIARGLLYLDADCPCCDYVKHHPVLKGVGRAVEERGMRFLIMFNLAYVPVAVKNYGLGFVPEVS